MFSNKTLAKHASNNVLETAPSPRSSPSSPCTVFPLPSSPSSSSSSLHASHSRRPSAIVTAQDDHTSCFCSPLRIARFSCATKSWAVPSPTRRTRFSLWRPWRSSTHTKCRNRANNNRKSDHSTLCELQRPCSQRSLHLVSPPSPTIHLLSASQFSPNSPLKPVAVPNESSAAIRAQAPLRTPASSSSFSPLSDDESSISTACAPHSSNNSSHNSAIQPSLSPVDALSHHYSGPHSMSNDNRVLVDPPERNLSAFADHSSTDGGLSDTAFSDSSDDQAVGTLQAYNEPLQNKSLDAYGEGSNGDVDGLDDLFNESDGDSNSSGRSSLTSNRFEDGCEDAVCTHSQFLSGDAFLPLEDVAALDGSVFRVCEKKVEEWHDDGVKHNRRLNHGFSNVENCMDIRSLACQFLETHRPP